MKIDEVCLLSICDGTPTSIMKGRVLRKLIQVRKKRKREENIGIKEHFVPQLISTIDLSVPDNLIFLVSYNCRRYCIHEELRLQETRPVLHEVANECKLLSKLKQHYGVRYARRP